MKSKESKLKPSISKATTKDKKKALSEIIGLWENREETKNVKEFRKRLWRETK